MVKEEGYNISDLGNWNVASDYSRLKIMKPLDYCDHYENIARFGYDTMLEEIGNFNVPVESLKLIGFDRLVNELIKLCGNCKFAMKVGKTREEVEKFEKQLKEIRSLIPLLSKTIKKRNHSEIRLDNSKYYKLLDIVIDIKAKINEPLNKNHLIFTDKEEFDPQAYKKQIMEGAMSRG